MKRNQVRVIGGKWRSRQIHFPDLPGLRPTPDRIRETLFNWLAPHIVDARCLDLFAGSGAFGFEALSRGARHVILVEQNPAIIIALQKNADIFKADQLDIIQQDALSWLKLDNHHTPFDIIFLDPPYQAKLLPSVFVLLETYGWLHVNSFIYFEADYPLAETALPPHWKLVREKKAGNIYYFLAQKIS